MRRGFEYYTQRVSIYLTLGRILRGELLVRTGLYGKTNKEIWIGVDRRESLWEFERGLVCETGLRVEAVYRTAKGRWRVGYDDVLGNYIDRDLFFYAGKAALIRELHS